MDLLVPIYVQESLHRYHHPKSSIPQDSLQPYVHPKYGNNPQNTKLPYESPVISDIKQKILQQIVGIFLYYEFTVDPPHHCYRPQPPGHGPTKGKRKNFQVNDAFYQLLSNTPQCETQNQPPGRPVPAGQGRAGRPRKHSSVRRDSRGKRTVVRGKGEGVGGGRKRDGHHARLEREFERRRRHAFPGESLPDESRDSC